MPAENSWRFLSRDPDTGAVEHYKYDPDGERCIIRRTADVEPLIEANKRLANAWDGWQDKRHEMRLAARISPEIQLIWLQKYGVRAWDRNHKKKVVELLNSNEWRYLRIGHFMI
jgi:hypothetical protein